MKDNSIEILANDVNTETPESVDRYDENGTSELEASIFNQLKSVKTVVKLGREPIKWTKPILNLIPENMDLIPKNTKGVLKALEEHLKYPLNAKDRRAFLQAFNKGLLGNIRIDIGKRNAVAKSFIQWYKLNELIKTYKIDALINAMDAPLKSINFTITALINLTDPNGIEGFLAFVFESIVRPTELVFIEQANPIFSFPAIMLLEGLGASFIVAHVITPIVIGIFVTKPIWDYMERNERAIIKDLQKNSNGAPLDAMAAPIVIASGLGMPYVFVPLAGSMLFMKLMKKCPWSVSLASNPALQKTYDTKRATISESLPFQKSFDTQHDRTDALPNFSASRERIQSETPPPVSSSRTQSLPTSVEIIIEGRRVMATIHQPEVEEPVPVEWTINDIVQDIVSGYAKGIGQPEATSPFPSLLSSASQEPSTKKSNKQRNQAYETTSTKDPFSQDAFKSTRVMGHEFGEKNQHQNAQDSMLYGRPVSLPEQDKNVIDVSPGQHVSGKPTINFQVPISSSKDSSGFKTSVTTDFLSFLYAARDVLQYISDAKQRGKKENQIKDICNALMKNTSDKKLFQKIEEANHLSGIEKNMLIYLVLNANDRALHVPLIQSFWVNKAKINEDCQDRVDLLLNEKIRQRIEVEKRQWPIYNDTYQERQHSDAILRLMHIAARGSDQEKYLTYLKLESEDQASLQVIVHSPIASRESKLPLVMEHDNTAINSHFALKEEESHAYDLNSTQLLEKMQELQSITSLNQPEKDRALRDLNDRLGKNRTEQFKLVVNQYQANTNNTYFFAKYIELAAILQKQDVLGQVIHSELNAIQSGPYDTPEQLARLSGARFAAFIYAMNGNPQQEAVGIDAMKQFCMGTLSNAENAEYHFYQAMISRKHGQVKEATDFLKQAFESDPSTTIYAGQLKYLLQVQLNDIENALFITNTLTHCLKVYTEWLRHAEMLQKRQSGWVEYLELMDHVGMSLVALHFQEMKYQVMQDIHEITMKQQCIHEDGTIDSEKLAEYKTIHSKDLLDNLHMAQIGIVIFKILAFLGPRVSYCDVEGETLEQKTERKRELIKSYEQIDNALDASSAGVLSIIAATHLKNLLIDNPEIGCALNAMRSLDFSLLNNLKVEQVVDLFGSLYGVITPIVSYAFRDYYRNRRRRGDAPTTLLDISGEQTLLFINLPGACSSFLTSQIHKTSTFRAAQDYLASRSPNLGLPMFEVAVMVGPAVVVGLIIIKGSPTVIAAGIATAKTVITTATTYWVSGLAGKVLVICTGGAAIIVVGIAAYQYNNHCWYQNVLSNANAYLTFIGTDRCDLHLNSVLPKDLLPYKESYILIDDGKKNGARLVYINSGCKEEPVTIDNMDLFKTNIKAINTDNTSTISLNRKQVDTVITSRGGNTPIVFKTTDDHVKESKKRVQEVLDFYPNDTNATIKMREINDIESLIREAKQRLNEENITPLLSIIEKQPVDRRKLFETALHDTYEKHLAGIQQTMDAIQKDETMDITKKSKQLSLFRTESSQCNQQQYQLCSWQAKNASPAEKAIFVTNKALLGKEIIRTEIDRELQSSGKGNLTKARYYLDELNKDSQQDAVSESLMSKVVLHEEFRKPVLERDSSFTPTYLQKLSSCSLRIIYSDWSSEDKIRVEQLKEVLIYFNQKDNTYTLYFNQSGKNVYLLITNIKTQSLLKKYTDTKSTEIASHDIQELNKIIAFYQNTTLISYDRLYYGYIANSDYIKEMNAIVKEIKQISDDKTKTRKEKSTAIEVLCIKINKLNEARYPLIQQEADYHPYNDALLIQRLQIAASQNDAHALRVIEDTLSKRSGSTLPQAVINEMKLTTYTLATKAKRIDRNKIIEKLVTIAQHDQSNEQKADTHRKVADLNSLDVYVHRSKLLEHYQKAFALAPLHAEGAMKHANECCFKYAFNDAINSLDNTIAAKWKEKEESKTEHEISTILSDIDALEKYKHYVIDMHINTIVFYGNLGLKGMSWLTHTLASSNYCNDAYKQSIELLERNLGVGGTLANFYAQLVQHSRLTDDPNASFELQDIFLKHKQASEAQIVYTLANIALQSLGSWRGQKQTVRLGFSTFYVDSLQVSTSMMSSCRGLNESCLNLPSNISLQTYGKFGIEGVRIVSTAASFIKKHGFSHYRQMGDAPTSFSMMFLEEVNNFLCNDYVMNALSLYSNASVLYGGLGWILARCQPRIGDTLEQLVDTTVETALEQGPTFIRSHNELLEPAAIALILACFMRRSTFIQYCSNRWRQNLFQNAETKLTLSFEDAQNRDAHLKRSLHYLNTILAHDPNDSLASNLKKTALIIKRAYRSNGSFEQIVVMLSNRFEFDKENAALIGLTIIQVICEKISNPQHAFTEQEIALFVLKGLDVIKKMKSFLEKLSSSVQSYLKQREQEFTAYLTQQSMQATENQQAEPERPPIHEESDNIFVKTMMGILAGCSIMKEPAAAAYFFVSMRLYYHLADFSRSNTAGSDSEPSSDTLDTEGNHAQYRSSILGVVGMGLIAASPVGGALAVASTALYLCSKKNQERVVDSHESTHAVVAKKAYGDQGFFKAFQSAIQKQSAANTLADDSKLMCK